MKKIITTIKTAFAQKNTYTATMIIAGMTVTHSVKARDYNSALKQAEIIVDDCGFVVDITAA